MTFSPLADNPEDPQVCSTVNFAVLAVCNFLVHLRNFIIWPVFVVDITRASDRMQWCRFA